MIDALPAALSPWESFYVIVGSSAAALTGLQFVVMALVSDSRAKTSTETIGAFGTPTIVHFCAAFFVAVALSAPWHALSNAAIVIGIAAGAGVLYTALVTRRARRQTDYVPVLEDWIWHTALPFLSYAAILSGALTLTHETTDALFGIAAASVLLLFVGIHNAWDTVTYVAQQRAAGKDTKG
ncbi:MAG: hypothetical protein ACHQRL_06530 [Gemmatimonadales bacterium]